MLVSVHVVARLFRVPILRIDGDVVLVDDDRLGHAAGQGRAPTARQELTAGRLLALAEAELAAADRNRHRRAS